MFKTLALVAAGGLALAAPYSALAQTFSPTNSTSVLTGTMYFEDSTSALTCDVAITIGIDLFGYAHVNQVTFSSMAFPAYCGFIVRPITNPPWTIAPVFHGPYDTLGLTLEIETVSDRCWGTVTAEYSSVTGLMSFSLTSLDTPWGTPCSIEGQFSAFPIFSF